MIYCLLLAHGNCAEIPNVIIAFKTTLCFCLDLSIVNDQYIIKHGSVETLE